MLRRLFLVASALLVASFSDAAEPAALVRTLYLVRHGIYDVHSGADEKIGNGLNPLGREQAEFAAVRLASLPVIFDSVVSSEFLRAKETADIIAVKLGAKCVRDGFLNETTPPGVGLDAAKSPPTPGAEAQLEAAWARYSLSPTGAPRNDLLVCHGNVIRWFVCKALGVDQNQWTRMRIANCSLTLIAIRADGTATLLMFNDTAHVPLNKQTWSTTNGPLWSAPTTTKTKS